MSSESLLSEHEEQTEGLLGNMEARAEHQKTKHYQSLYTFTTAMGVGLLILVLFWILHFRNGFAWHSDVGLQFNWHPYLMVLGMVFLYSQSMLIYRTVRNSPKKHLKILHAALHCLAFVLSVIGLKAVFDSHNLAKEPIPNLYSFHSWIGLITIIIFSAQFLSGFITFLYPGLATAMRQTLMPVHRAVGVGGFVLAIATTVTGLTEKVIWSVGAEYSKFDAEGVVCNLIGVFVVFYGVMVLYLVNEMDYKRVSLPEDEIALAASE
ncbi:hypothetical protein NQ317_007873 [Molorchus minor]|uniref:Cytochrome b561 domain-containing protein n=1 Tax=Molorchus minor TaxID=1323400 RepID=A0ABQ9J0F4_9CUCU|nr:hypothetical protein NQ317_007873 [Molorchus minor]